MSGSPISNSHPLPILEPLAAQSTLESTLRSTLESTFDGDSAVSSSADAPLTIGVRDSGVGGLTVAREIRKRIPHARLLYFADTAHVPYGEKTPEQVRHFALSITRFLIDQGAQMVVFACNTSSAYALETAQSSFSLPLFGMIEPGARAAVEANKSTFRSPIGVLATSATVQSRMYAEWIRKLQPQMAALEIACPDFVPLVESEQGSTSEARKACEKAMKPLLEAGARTVILGCTHYPLLLPMLRSVAPEVCFVDPAESVARAIKTLVSARRSNISSPLPDTFFVSGPQSGVQSWVEKTLGFSEPNIVTAPIF